MTYPLTYKDNGVLKIMNTTELGTLAQQVLEYMAVNDGPGLLSLSNASGTYTVIGTFTDTAYESNIGGGNTQVNSNVITIYQDLTTPSGDEPPRFFKYNTGDAPVKLSSDSEIDDLANLILTWGLTNEGPHSFVIEESTPSDGGTWSDLGSLTEIYSGELTNSKKLFKKLSSGAYTLNRPLKTGGQGILQKFNDTDINNLAKKVRERIVNTGIGTYLFQASSPSPGTWVAKGSINDTRATANPTNYQSDTLYSGPDTYVGPAPAVYTGTVNVIYSGDNYTADYIGTYQNFTGYQISPAYENNYTVSTFFESNFQGPTYTIEYTNFLDFVATSYDNTFDVVYTGITTFVATYSGPIPSEFLGPATAYTNFTSFTNPDGVGYIRENPPRTFAGYEGPGTFGSNPIIVYSGPQDEFFLNFFTGPAGTFTAFYESLTGIFNGYTGPAIEFVPDAANYTATYLRSVNYTSIYVGAANYTGPEFYLNEYTRTLDYLSAYTRLNPDGNGYQRETFYTADAYYSGPLFYTAPTFFSTIVYTGVNPDGQQFIFPGGYTQWVQFSVQYTQDYTLSYVISAFYSEPYQLTYTGTYQNFTSFASFYTLDIFYSGTDDYEGATFVSNYDATGNPGTFYTVAVPVSYTAVLPDTGSYINEQAIPYTVDYEGLLIEDTPDTISTITLWRRVA